MWSFPRQSFVAPDKVFEKQQVGVLKPNTCCLSKLGDEFVIA